MTLRSWAPCCLLLAAAGCGRPAGEPARFSGRYGAGHVGAASVKEVSERPLGYRSLGTLTAHCRADSGIATLDREMLGDIDCSEALLLSLLRAKAATVGGELLVAPHCETETERDGDVESIAILCASKVAAAAPGASTLVPEARAVEGPPPPYADIDDAFRVAVTVTPVDLTAGARKARDPERVAELAYVLPGRVAFADVVARCRDECGRDAVRYAVRAGAARVGATEVIGIACVHARGGFLCTGRAARPEVDPELDARAR